MFALADSEDTVADKAHARDDWMCRTACTADEAKALIEVGFEYVNEINGIHLYQKRK